LSKLPLTTITMICSIGIRSKRGCGSSSSSLGSLFAAQSIWLLVWLDGTQLARVLLRQL
jgi:hypothetical protein